MYIHRDNARNIGGFVYICRMRIYDMNSMRALWCKKKKNHTILGLNPRSTIFEKDDFEKVI